MVGLAKAVPVICLANVSRNHPQEQVLPFFSFAENDNGQDLGAVVVVVEHIWQNRGDASVTVVYKGMPFHLISFHFMRAYITTLSTTRFISSKVGLRLEENCF